MKELTLAAPHIHRLVVPFLDIYTTIFLIDTPEGLVVFDQKNRGVNVQKGDHQTVDMGRG